MILPEVTSFIQRHQSVEEYVREFEQLHILSGLEDELDHTMVRFLKGLSSSIAMKV